VSEEQIAMPINTALTRKPRGKTRWSRRSLADGTGLSKNTVHRHLTLFGLQPYRAKRFTLSKSRCSMRHSSRRRPLNGGERAPRRPCRVRNTPASRRTAPKEPLCDNRLPG
jgi:hypothetical protein